MKRGKVETYINEQLEGRGALLFTLIDPIDYKSEDAAVKTASDAARGGADIVLLGGSIGVHGSVLDNVARRVKEEVEVPIVLFPGNMATITPHADAIYFLSLLNSRNPYWHVEAQMLGAPLIRKFAIEPMPVGYIVVAPGGTAGWVADANLVPREKPKVAAMLAMTGEYLGQRIIVTDTGSNPQAQGMGAIPSDMIRAVKSSISVPYVVGGGIRTGADAKRVLSSGADIIQIGTAFEGGRDGVAYRTAAAFSRVVKEEGRKKLGKA